jgi:hypothetical protein
VNLNISHKLCDKWQTISLCSGYPQYILVYMNQNQKDRHIGKSILIRLPEELIKRLRAVAKKHSTTMRAVMETGIERRVCELEKKDPV